MPESDDELLAKAIERDTTALSELLERHGPQVRHALRIDRKWQSLLSTEDVMQVTYFEAYLQIDRFSPRGEGSFRAWLRRIAENNLRDAIKELERGKRRPPGKRIKAVPGEDSSIALLERLGGSTTAPIGRAARHEIKEFLEDAIGRLPEDYQTVIRLYDLEGRCVTEAASSMGRSKGAVYMLRARAHDRLREALGSGSKFFSDQA